MEIEWDDPPEDVLFRHANRGKYVDLAMALRENPGKWARMPAEAAQTEKSAQGLLQGLKRGSVTGFKPKGAFDAVRKETTVWVKFVGDPTPPEAQGNGSDDDPPVDPPDPDDPDDEGDIDPKAVRAWARKNGWPDLSERGRLSGEILEAYQNQQPKPDLRSV